jgi:hypothetical protein
MFGPRYRSVASPLPVKSIRQIEATEWFASLVLPVSGAIHQIKESFGGFLFFRSPFVAELVPAADQRLVGDIDVGFRSEKAISRNEKVASPFRK